VAEPGVAQRGVPARPALALLLALLVILIGPGVTPVGAAPAFERPVAEHAELAADRTHDHAVARPGHPAHPVPGGLHAVLPVAVPVAPVAETGPEPAGAGAAPTDADRTAQPARAPPAAVA
jgi:hypothetical protein